MHPRLRWIHPGASKAKPALVSLLVVSLAVGCARSPSKGPLQLRQLPSRQVLVPVSINGTPAVPFILDTGAGGTVITPATRARLGLSPAGDDVVVGADGVESLAKTYRLASVRVGAEETRDVNAAEDPLDDVLAIDRTIGGVLGRDVLGGYDIELDFEHKTMRLSRPAGATRAGTIALPFHELPSGLFTVDATLDGTPVQAVVDLGASASVANPRAGGPATAETRSARGVGQQTLTLSKKRFDRFALAGGPAWSGPTLYVADLPVFATLGLSDRPAMILGLDFLGDRLVVVDYVHRRLRLGTRSSPRP